MIKARMPGHVQVAVLGAMNAFANGPAVLVAIEIASEDFDVFLWEACDGISADDRPQVDEVTVSCSWQTSWQTPVAIRRQKS